MVKRMVEGKFSKQFAARMKIISIALAFIVILSNPLGYLLTAIDERESHIQKYAEELAIKSKPIIIENPKLWHYSFFKFIEVITNNPSGEEIISVSIYNDRGVLLHEEPIAEAKYPFLISQASPILYNGEVYGSVVVTSNPHKIVINTIAILFFSLIIGIAIVYGIYFYPLKMIRKSESEVTEIFQKLTDTNRELNETNRKLNDMVALDGRTGLFNAAYMFEYLQERMEMLAAKEISSISVIMIDIDYFKKYNDLHGHLQGDKLIATLAELLQGQVNKGDVIGRYGGEEFIVVQVNHSFDDAYSTAEQMRSVVNDYCFEGEEFMPRGNLTISAGISYCDEPELPQELINQADQALYYAKEVGRNNVQYFQPISLLAETTEGLLRPNLDMKAEVVGKVMDKFFENQRSIADVYEPTARGLLKALEFWDQATVRHSLRVNKIASQIGFQLGLSKNDLADLELGTLLHDIGKLSIGDTVLLKPGPLTDEEYQLIKNHPQIGFDMVKDNPQFQVIAEVILHHHERFDGKGYPAGLQGTDIPLLARICSVADSFEAITADRPYRKGRSIQEAKSEIEKHKGTQFDPQVVDALLALQYSAIYNEEHLILAEQMTLGLATNI